jgi:hypothetical protein
MNTFYTIEFTDKTVIWTKFSMSSTQTKTRLTPKGVSKLDTLKSNSNRLTFNCTEAALADVIHSMTFFIKAKLDIVR